MEIASVSQKVRNARACESCRSSKSRCLFSNQRNICQRCEQTGNACIVRAKARPMRARPTQNSANSSASRLDDSEFSIELPAVSAPDPSVDCEELLQHHKTFFADEHTDGLKKGQSSSPSKIPPIERRKVDRNQAERLLLAFRTKAPFFPFIAIPLDATVPTLSRTSPFLLLAILTVGSSSDPKLHHQMDQEFRRVLSSKVIVEGRKSLDFLQGMLLYIAWYPMHSKARNNQSFMYLSLAISLAIDLGLDEKRPNENNFSTINTNGLIEDGVFTKSAKRAYLGCCYLTSGLSSPLIKSNLRYCNLVNAQDESLLHDELSNEHTLSEVTSLVKLHRLIERIAEAYSSKSGASQDFQNGHLTTGTDFGMFVKELQDWSATTFNWIRNLPIIGLAERFVTIAIYSYELGLLRRQYNIHLTSTVDAIPAHQPHLWQCLDACKRFFEFLLSIPESTYPNFTCVQWTSIVHAILVLSRLTFLMASNLAWDPDTTRANVPFVMYLDAFSYRLQLISSTLTTSSPSDRPQNPDALYVFNIILRSVKESYERRVAGIRPTPLAVELGSPVGGSGGVARGYCPRLDPTLEVYFDAVIDDSAYGDSLIATPASSNGSMPVYYDLWATMTGRWAEEI